MLISLRPIGEGSGSNVDVDDDFVVEVVVVVVFVVTIVEGAFILSLMSKVMRSAGLCDLSNEYQNI